MTFGGVRASPMTIRRSANRRLPIFVHFSPLDPLPIWQPSRPQNEPWRENQKWRVVLESLGIFPCFDQPWKNCIRILFFRLGQWCDGRNDSLLQAKI